MIAPRTQRIARGYTNFQRKPQLPSAGDGKVLRQVAERGKRPGDSLGFRRIGRLAPWRFQADGTSARDLFADRIRCGIGIHVGGVSSNSVFVKLFQSRFEGSTLSRIDTAVTVQHRPQRHRQSLRFALNSDSSQSENISGVTQERIQDSSENKNAACAFKMILWFLSKTDVLGELR